MYYAGIDLGGTNIAAGIVIRQFGCATTSVEEIQREIPDKINLEF